MSLCLPAAPAAQAGNSVFLWCRGEMKTPPIARARVPHIVGITGAVFCSGIPVMHRPDDDENNTVSQRSPVSRVLSLRPSPSAEDGYPSCPGVAVRVLRPTLPPAPCGTLGRATRKADRLALLRVEIAAFHVPALRAGVNRKPLTVHSDITLFTVHCPLRCAATVTRLCGSNPPRHFCRRSRRYRDTLPCGARTFLPTTSKRWRGNHPATVG